MSTTRRPRDAAADPPPEDRATSIANRYNSLAIHLVRRLRREDEALGITGARLSALSVLVFGGDCTIGELAAVEQVAPPTMTRIVDALERAGLASRSPDAADRRVTRVRATTKGRRLMARGRAARVRRLAAELRALDAADLDTLERAAAVLERLEAGQDLR